MKKILFGSTMLVAVGALTGTAVAADPISLSLGGKQEQYFGGVSTFKDGNREDGFGVDTDTEVYFKGSTTLDNGITVAAMIQLEAEADNAVNADEQYVTVSGAFGKIQAGQKEGAFDQLTVYAPVVGWVSLNDTADWLGYAGTSSFARGSNYYNLDQTLNDDDAKISYFTPKFYGFSAGASYTPQPGGSLVPATKKNRDLAQFGIGYDNKFGDIGVKASATAATQSNFWIYQGGLSANYAGFTLGGTYTEIDDESASSGTVYSTAPSSEGRLWSAGLSYATGPYSVGFAYAQTNHKSGGDNAIYKLGADYKMGPGISLVGNVFYGENDSNTAAGSREGVGAVTGIVLAF
ncbi:porin [Rhodospirillum rubrum]|uniref:Porin domain-containing protein n=2 Tax=Rhodospirillum rubrum TaxID=1085 RepID=Q2RS83_RHORT|nr:porin [Rhodospirillum rubrum]ABC23012.1 hypothetical protein Rru_A2212 [Rhodospirillum rubrum ATCC 11170]AEO48741.1 hypothetical protein F11_11385 [Rhodospirillum rubrum F11]MBK5954635.1 porin [Rhodospirillum rubrum]QXG78996.1 porin [Rhodospirillum rubrum]CAB99325.1 porin 39 (Por39) [Rhodospirillum rubrum]